MTSFSDSLADAIRNAYCTMLRNGNNFLEHFAPRIGVIPNPGLMAGRFAYRLVCNREPPPMPQPPFTGGQCTDIFYQVRVTYTGFDQDDNADPNTTGNPQTFSSFGPIRGAVVRQSSTAFTVVGLGQPRPGNPDGEWQLGTLNKSFYKRVQIDNIQVIPPPGVPDICGDPPPVIVPPAPNYNVFAPTINFNDGDNNSVNLPVTLIFAPVRLNLEGNLVVPLRINLEPTFNFPFNGEFNLNTGGINFNFGSPNYSPTPTPSPDGYDCPPTTPEDPVDDITDVPIPGDDDDPNDDTARILRACIVTVNVIPKDITIIFQDDNPDILAPNLGYVQFAIAVGNRLSWTSDIPVKNRRNFIPCPWEGGALQVRGTPRPGVVWTISPVYANVEDVITFA